METERQQAWANDLFHKTNADVLVSTTIERDDNRSTLTVAAYIGATPGAEDLAGQELMRLPFTVDYDIAEFQDGPHGLAANASRDLTAIATLLDGLAAYGRRDMEQTKFALDAVLAGETVFSDATLVLLHHLRGNALNSLGDMVAAESEYREALRRDPSFARSTIGLAEVFRHNSGPAGCQPPRLNSDGIKDALALLEPLLQNDSRTIVLKAHVGLAQTWSCVARAYPGLWLVSASSSGQVSANGGDQTRTYAQRAKGFVAPHPCAGARYF